MIKAIIILLLIFPLIAITYATKTPQTETSTEKNQQQNSIRNFLEGNRYLLTSSYDNRSQDKEKFTQLNLENNQKDSNGKFIYGIFIEFIDTMHYRSYNIEPCGNSCFFTTVGKYNLSSNNELSLVMDSTTYRFFCNGTPTKYGDGKKDIYKITRLHNDSVIRLIKQN